MSACETCGRSHPTESGECCFDEGSSGMNHTSCCPMLDDSAPDAGPKPVDVLSALVRVLAAQDREALERDILRRATAEGWIVVPQSTPDLTAWDGHVYRDRDAASSLATELSMRGATKRTTLRVTVHLGTLALDQEP